jgi:hypothetical protein
MSRGSRLYQDPRAWASDAIVEADCAREGIRDRHAIDARKAAARATDAALLAKNDEDVLPVSVYRDLRASGSQARLTPEGMAERTELIHQHLAEPLATARKDVPARVAALNADLVQRPELNAAMARRAAGYSVPVVRHLARLAAEREVRHTTAKPVPVILSVRSKGT